MLIGRKGGVHPIVRRLGACIGERVVLTRLAAGLLAIVVLAIIVTVYEQRRTALAEAWTNSDNLAVVLAEQTNRSVQAVDIVLRDIQERIAALGVTTPEAFRSVLRTREFHDYLRGRADRLPQADNIAMIGADGVRVNFALGWPAPAFDMSDRDYTRHFSAHDDRGLFVSEPVVSRATGVWTLYLGRRVNGPRNEFLGIVLGSLPLRVFEDLFRSINLPQGQSFMLLRRDGTTLVRHPKTADQTGMKIPAGSPWYALLSEGGGHFEASGAFDTTQRLIAMRALRDYPLVIDVGVSRDRVLAQWRRDATLILLGTFGSAACLLFLLRTLAMQFRRLQASEARLAATSRDLAITLESMDQGLVMVDATGAVAVCNRRAIEILELPADLMARHPRLDTVAHLRIIADAAGTCAPVTSGRAWDATGGSPSVSECVLPNGHVVEIRRRPLPCDAGWMATCDDITARRQAEDKIVFMARHDALTRLPNRILFRERLEAALAQVARGSMAAVLCLDLDHFKSVNDTLGHPIGDRLLRMVAERLCACFREQDTVARFGGDEFAVVQIAPARAEDVATLSQRIIEIVSLPYEIDGNRIIIGTSVGIAMVPADGSDADTLLKNADIALYRAKDEGRGTYRFFAPEMDARLQRRRELKLDLHNALVNDEFELYFQPLLDLTRDRIVGFEALLRWHHPTRGAMQPGEFIQLIDEMALAIPLGQWVLRRACQEAMTWPDDVTVAVNLSPVQFAHPDLVRQVAEVLRETGLAPWRLNLEITESLLSSHRAEDAGMLQALHDLGVHISLGDFGAEHSSLSHLRNLPISKVKIGRSVIGSLTEDEVAAAIVHAVAALGRSLGIAVVAEGVERADQLERLRDEGCHEVQGFLFSVPRPASAIPGLLEHCRLHHSDMDATQSDGAVDITGMDDGRVPYDMKLAGNAMAHGDAR